MAKSKESINRDYRIKVRDLRRQYLDKELGDRCFFCDGRNNLASHRKDGEEHYKISYMGLERLRNEVTRKDYVRLCYPCHKGTHWAMQHLGVSWDDILRKHGNVAQMA